MLVPFRDIQTIRKFVNKQKNYVVCQFCNKPILVKEMVSHMSIHKEI